MSAFHLTKFTKTGGPLTKQISLTREGKVHSDGSACVMSRGFAERVKILGVQELAELISNLESNQAIALGVLRSDLPAMVELTTKRELDELNGTAAPDIIARTASHIAYVPGQPAFALLDFDTKGMPATVEKRLEELGGFSRALHSVLPELAGAARLYRRSTSAGLWRTDTGEQILGSNGVHLYMAVADGDDTERFLAVLHARCWLTGLGWLMVGKTGQLLERSIVDRMVGAPERLVFEGAPVLLNPLAQDGESRRPAIKNGDILDTIAACPALSIVEQSKLKQLRAAEAHRLSSESAKARHAFVQQQAARIAIRIGIPHHQAARIVERQCNGVLLPDVVLPFDDPDLAGTTVADILADPGRYEGATLADPLEGVDYGRCKARVMRRADGAPWIHSFAHGRTVYELRYDAAAIAATVAAKPADQAGDVFVRTVLRADLDPDEAESLRNLAAERAGVSKRALSTKLRHARQEQCSRDEEDAQQQRLALRRDRRPQVPAPLSDAPWIPQMQLLNEVLGSSGAPEPPMRDIDGAMTAVRVRGVGALHVLTAIGANGEETEETHLPAPEQPLLTRLGEAEVAEIIEQHIEYVDRTGRPVHLALPFVRQFLVRSDNVLPTVTAVATLPVVLPDGTVLSGSGLDRKYGVVFRVPSELQRLLPDQASCTELAVAEAMRFLTDEWLCDVAADYSGKCVLIAGAATILERLVVPERPAFFVTAGHRGGGKTTAINMLSMAVFGRRAAAAGWSSSEEERRKALFSYLGEGMPMLVWDNIPRGALISCPSIEKSLTAEAYCDRVLGESATRTVPACVAMFFTGNNIAPRGDMASRSLIVRLSVDRLDPENREFQHADPLAWTESLSGRSAACAVHRNSGQSAAAAAEVSGAGDALQGLVALGRFGS